MKNGFFTATRASRGLLAALPVVMLIIVVLRSGSLHALREVFERTAPSVWLLALCGQGASYAGRAMRLVIVDRKRFGGRFWTCLRLILVNNALNLALPLRAGEASFPLLLKRWFGVSLAEAAGMLLWMRLLDLQVLALAALLAVGWWTADSAPLSPLRIVGLFVLLVAPLLLRVLHAPLQRQLSAHSSRAATLLLRALSGMPDRTATLLGAWLWTLASWGVKLVVLGQLLAALAGLPPPIGTLGVVGADLSTVLPLHSPGGFGTFEAAIVAMIGFWRTPDAALLAAALSFHLFVLGFALLAGLLAWLLPAGTRTAEADNSLQR